MSARALFAVFIVAAAGCAGEAPDGTVVNAPVDTVQTPPTPAVPAGPRLEFFSSSDSVMAVVDGAGCGYSAPGVTGDSSLFAFSTDGVILVNGRLQTLKPVGEGIYTDSTAETRWENTRYRLYLSTVDDSTYSEVGVSQHGEITVEEKATGGKTTVAIVGGCGC